VVTAGSVTRTGVDDLRGCGGESCQCKKEIEHSSVPDASRRVTAKESSNREAKCYVSHGSKMQEKFKRQWAVSRGGTGYSAAWLIF
jgi:hypothetical protein